MIGDPLDGDFVRQRAGRHLHQPGAGHVGDEEHRRHGQWIGQPDQADRDWQITPQWDCQAGGQQHLHGHGNQCRKQADAHGPRHRMAVQVPEVGIVQQPAEKA
ncbi:hypothetical protein HMPREF3173_11705 [Pseudomonas sp. HMSC08G10]|nr:hypothetical protein HMPREF3173_11705 [Pseudomonas sp. HMSC08G10]